MTRCVLLSVLSGSCNCHSPYFWNRNIMTKFLGITIVLLVSGLAGCSTLNCGDSHPYANSIAGPPLKAPPGLSVPAPDPNYAIQGLGPNQTKVAANGAKGTCLVKPPQLINAQPAAAPNPKPSSVSSMPVPTPTSTQPSMKPDNKKPTSPASSTTVTPPVVAGSGRVG